MDGIGDAIVIPLTQGLLTIVDIEDEDLKQYSWFCQRSRNTYYAARVRPENEHWNKETGKHIYMHRIIGERIGVIDYEWFYCIDVEIDHINRYGWDNRRQNIRSVTRSENLRNNRGHG